MITNRHRARTAHLAFLFGVLAAAGLAGAASAAMDDRGYSRDASALSRDGTVLSDSRTTSDGTFHPQALRTRDLLERSIVNAQGQKVGEVEDIVLTPDHDHVAYVAVEVPRYLHLRHKLVAVPWSAFHVSPAADGHGRLIINATAEDLRNAPGFSPRHWPADASADWRSAAAGPTERVEATASFDARPPYAMEPSAGYGYDSTGVGRTSPSNAIANQQIYTTGEYPIYDPTAWQGEPTTAAMRERAHHHDATLDSLRVSKLIDKEITLNDNRIGKLNDVVIDPRDGSVGYAVLSFNSRIPELNKRLAVVPWETLRVQPRSDVIPLYATRAQLRDDSFAVGQFPNLADPVVATRIYDRFDAQPYWQTYGFVGDNAEPMAGHTMDHKQKLAAKDMVTVTGTVESVETMAGKKMPDGRTAGEHVVAKVKTDDGKIVSVPLGPKSYVDSQNLILAAGDKVTMKGWTIDRDGKNAFIASEVKKGNQTILLRRDDGTPLWEKHVTSEKDKMDVK